MSAWNDFVKKIYWENKKKNKNYQFKEALKEASKRKGEMGTKGNKTAAMKSKKGCKCPKNGTRKRRTRRH